VLYCWLYSRSIPSTPITSTTTISSSTTTMTPATRFPCTTYQLILDNDIIVLDFATSNTIQLSTNTTPTTPFITIRMSEDKFFNAVDRALFLPIIQLMVGSEIGGGFEGYMMTWALMNRFVKPKVFDTFDQE
jgi:hypothetical protein